MRCYYFFVDVGMVWSFIFFREKYMVLWYYFFFIGIEVYEYIVYVKIRVYCLRCFIDFGGYVIGDYIGSFSGIVRVSWLLVYFIRDIVFVVFVFNGRGIEMNTINLKVLNIDLF